PIAIPPAAQRLIEDFVATKTGADACVFAVTAAQDALVATFATPRIRDAVTSVTMPVGSGVSGWVAANRSTIRRADPALDLGELAPRFGRQMCVSVPLLVRGELFGVLTIYVTDTAMSDDDVADAGLLAQEVGLSIARASRLQVPARSARPPIAAAS